MKKVAPYAPESLALYDRNMQRDRQKVGPNQKRRVRLHILFLIKPITLFLFS